MVAVNKVCTKEFIHNYKLLSEQDLKGYKNFKENNAAPALIDVIHNLRNQILTICTNKPKQHPRYVESLETVDKGLDSLQRNFKIIRNKEKGLMTRLFCFLFPKSDFAKKIHHQDLISHSLIHQLHCTCSGLITLQKWEMAIQQISKKEYSSDESTLSLMAQPGFAQKSAEHIKKWLGNTTGNASDKGELIYKSIMDILGEYLPSDKLAGAEKTNDVMLAMILAALPYLLAEDLFLLQTNSEIWAKEADAVDSKTMKAKQQEKWFIQANYIYRLAEQVQTADKLAEQYLSQHKP